MLGCARQFSHYIGKIISVRLSMRFLSFVECTHSVQRKIISANDVHQNKIEEKSFVGELTAWSKDTAPPKNIKQVHILFKILSVIISLCVLTLASGRLAPTRSWSAVDWFESWSVNIEKYFIIERFFTNWTYNFFNSRLGTKMPCCRSTRAK